MLREVAGGEAVAITNRGEVVAHLVPPTERPAGLRIARPARHRIEISSLVRVVLGEPSSTTLDAQRADR